VSERILSVTVQFGEDGKVWEATVDLGEAKPGLHAMLVEQLLLEVDRRVRSVTGAAPSTSFAGSPPPLRRGGPQ